METATVKRDLEQQLYSEVDKWVNTNFNFIQLNVFETMANDNLYEYIRQSKPDLMDFLYNYDLTEDCSNDLGQEINTLTIEEFEDEVQEWIDENALDEFDSYNQDQENYPMWGTIFEFRSEPSEEMVEACEKAGFGIIEGMDDFNTALFVMGCGYSFYAQHWIPAYLNWNQYAREEYKGVKYDHL